MGRRHSQEVVEIEGSKIAALKAAAPRLLTLARPHSLSLLLGLISLTLAGGINLLFPYLIRGALNEEFGFRLSEDLLQITLILIALFGAQAFLFYLRHYFFSAVGYRVVAELRQRLYEAIIGKDIAFFDRSRSGDLLSRLSSDTELVQRAVTVNVSIALRYLLQVIGGTVLMCVISVKLTLVILVLIPVLVLGSGFWGRKLRVLSKKMQKELGDANVIAEETVAAVRTVQSFAGAAYESKRYSEAIDESLETGISRAKIASAFSSAMVFLMHSAIAGVVWFGGEMVLSGALSIGDLTGFLLYCVIVAVSFGFLANVWVEFMQAVGASERIFEIIDTVNAVVSPSSPRAIPIQQAGSVLFSNVSFSYPARAEIPVLKNISFEIPEGKTIAIVGPSGSGKSTIAYLIPRFYDPTQGNIRYSGIDLKDLELSELRKEVSIVAQQPQVFSISIGENIRYGKIGASVDEIRRAAKAANIDDFIESLPKGYDTLVGDKGIQLSGGERQRIAIARAILKDPKFLILDEATSALDSENEQLVQQALERLMFGRTTMIIAHRLSTVQHADRVIVLKDGQICQTGTHESLYKEEGLYRTLVEHQLLG